MRKSKKNKTNSVLAEGRHIVGIDIGRGHHAAAGITRDGLLFRRISSFSNDASGVERLEQVLLKPLGGASEILVGMEATGHYWMPLYFELTKRGYQVVVINPILTGNRSRARIRKTKNDRIDALGIAYLIRNGDAQYSRIPSEPVFELRLLARHRWRLQGIRDDLKRFALTLVDRLFPEYRKLFCNSLNVTSQALIHEIGLIPGWLTANEATVYDVVRRASRNRVRPAKIKELLQQAERSLGMSMGKQIMLDQLRSTLKMIETINVEVVIQEEELERRVATLNSPLESLNFTAPLIATIHAESDPMTDFKTASEYAAYCGWDPSTIQSGDYKATKTRISKRGSPYLRHALFLGAWSLYRREKSLMSVYQRARKKGRHHLDALVIVAHKLSRIIWRLLIDQRPFRKRPPKVPDQFKIKRIVHVHRAQARKRKTQRRA